MANANLLPSQRAGVIGVIDPDVTVASTVTTAWVDAEEWGSMLAIIQVGTLGSSATVDAKLQQATDNSGTGAKDITGKAITQLTDAGTDSDKQALINLDEADLDTDNSFTFVQLSVTVAVATSDVSALLFGFDATTGPASDLDASTVDEIVA